MVPVGFSLEESVLGAAQESDRAKQWLTVLHRGVDLDFL